MMGGSPRSRRVAAVTLPFSIGTLRSTRSSTCLPFTLTSSWVRNLGMYSPDRHPEARAAQPRASKGARAAILRGAPRGAHLSMTTRKSEQFPHRDDGVGHAVGETPFYLVPGHHPYQRPLQHICLVHLE